MSQGKQRLLFWILGLVLAATSVAGTGFVLAARHSDPPAEPAAATVTRGDGFCRPGTVTCFGHADVEEGVAFLCPLQPGRVTEIYVHEDDEVAAGTTLLKLDTRQAELLVRQARADLDAARAQLARAEKRIDQQKVREAEQLAVIDAMEHRRQAARWMLARKRELASLATSDKEIAAAEEQCAELGAAVRGEEAKLQELRLNDPVLDSRSAQADVAAKQARLEQALLSLDECQLKAPVDGKVLRLLISRGDLLGPRPSRRGRPLSFARRHRASSGPKWSRNLRAGWWSATRFSSATTAGPDPVGAARFAGCPTGTATAAPYGRSPCSTTTCARLSV